MTTPNEGGYDPNIRSQIKFNVEIPGNSFYCPTMTCTVMDKLYFEGMKQPVLGTFAIDLGDILDATRNKDKRIIEELGKMNEKLKGVIRKKEESMRGDAQNG